MSEPVKKRIVALEIFTAFAACGAFVAACTNIRVNPLERMGQVSAIASVELRLLWFGLPLLLALILGAKLRGGRHFDLVARFTCAAFAGIASAAVAGGVMAALGKSHYGLGGTNGDSGVLIGWAELAKIGQVESPVYPPLQVQLLAWISQVFGMPTEYAMKVFQLLGIAIVGPLAYSTWRLLLRPTWALGISVVTALPLVEAYRQYPLLVLIVFIPLLVKFLQLLRRAPELTIARLIQCGALMGLSLGVLFLLYSGWFQWSAPGFIVAALIVAPWRAGWKAGAILSAVAMVVFALVTYRYVTGVVESVGVKDNFIYFDTTVDPTYIAMWRGDMPGKIGVWPPMGELGGAGLFTVLLAAGIGSAVALGRKRTVIIGVGAVMVGTWLFRFWHAHNMWRTKLVQLYPRTTAELLYCALIMSAFAVYFIVERARRKAPADSFLVTPNGFIGAFAGLLFLVMSSSSATIDKYMPSPELGDPGHVTYVALVTPPLEVSQTKGAKVQPSSWHEDPPRSALSYLIDGKYNTTFSSELGKHENHEESIVLEMPTIRTFEKLVLYPAPDGGFPVDFTFDLWDGSQWITRLSFTDYPEPHGKVELPLGRRDYTNIVRFRATKLRKVGDDYVLRLNELELRR